MRVTALVCLAGLLSACQSESQDPLVGKWLGINYQCPIGRVHKEVIRVEPQGDQLVAYKVTGDECVPAGEVTFSGTRDNIRCITGVPGDNTYSSYQSRVMAEDRDQFSVCGVTFERMRETGE